MNETISVILNRTSIRKFTGDTIADADLNLILSAGMSAPSAVNMQPWAFILVTDKDKLLLLKETLPYAKMLDKAAAAIIVCGLPEKDQVVSAKFWVQDCSAATENILLATHALGYGGVWTAVYPEEDRMQSVSEICCLPSTVIPLNVIPIGVPAKSNPTPIQKFKSDNIHVNQW